MYRIFTTDYIPGKQNYGIVMENSNNSIFMKCLWKWDIIFTQNKNSRNNANVNFPILFILEPQLLEILRNLQIQEHYCCNKPRSEIGPLQRKKWREVNTPSKNGCGTMKKEENFFINRSWAALSVTGRARNGCAQGSSEQWDISLTAFGNRRNILGTQHKQPTWSFCAVIRDVHIIGK